jgi:hypothetical protein
MKQWHQGPRPITATAKREEFTETLRETIGLEFEKRAAGMSSGLRNMKDWTLWRVGLLRNGKRDHAQSRSQK